MPGGKLKGSGARRGRIEIDETRPLSARAPKKSRLYWAMPPLPPKASPTRAKHLPPPDINRLLLRETCQQASRELVRRHPAEQPFPKSGHILELSINRRDEFEVPDVIRLE